MSTLYPLHSSPTSKMTDLASSSTLISKEDGARDCENAAQLLCEDTLMLEADDEQIESLLSREESRVSSSSSSSSQKKLKSERSDAVQWILRTRALLSFGMKTVYMAVGYFDHFFAHPAVDFMEGKSWAIRLLSVACLSLAAKMEELKAPTFAELQIEEYRFHAAAVQRMELLILSTLQWRMSTVTPFPYLSYFSSMFEEHGSKQLGWKAIKLIFASIEAMSLADYRPSVIAAAAILAASDERLTRESIESKMSAISSCRAFDTDNVFSCYILMTQEIRKKNTSSIYDSVGDNVSNSFLFASHKRRRLQ